MIARRTSSRRTKRQNIGALVNDLKKLSDRIDTARTGIGASIGDNFYCRDLDRLLADITELNRIIFELEKSGGGTP